eukprot:scaffold43.g4488.t1
MPGIKEIRTKIKSVQNTRKITKAMEMVAASKMRRAQERMRAGRPYATKVREIAAHLMQAHPEYSHPYLAEREIKTVGVVLVATDKGLCGGLNTNINRLTLAKLKEFEQRGIAVQATAFGNKGLGMLTRVGANLVSQETQLGDKPSLERLLGAIKSNYSWDYIYEPNAETVIDDLLQRYVEGLLYQAVAENMASEQSARMVAMKAASDNAKKVIGDLQLVYNKTRQAAITKEISEIVGGAAAV